MKVMNNDREKKKIKRKTHIIIYNARERKKGERDKKNGNEERMRG